MKATKTNPLTTARLCNYLCT